MRLVILVKMALVEPRVRLGLLVRLVILVKTVLLVSLRLLEPREPRGRWETRVPQVMPQGVQALQVPLVRLAPLARQV